MAKAYWVATYRTVSDPDALAAYGKVAGAALQAAGGRILARGMPEDDGELNEDAFEQGLQQARRSTGLLQTAFSARTLGLFDRLPAHALPSYLSGLVIGDELRAQGAALAPEVVIMANAALAQRYAIALKAWGVRSVRTLGSEASWQGLRMVAQALG